MSKEVCQMIDKVKNFKQTINEQKFPSNELQNIVKDYLNKRIQFTVNGKGISFYKTGDIKAINYHTNERGFSTQLVNCKFGGDARRLENQIKYGTNSVVILPVENSVVVDESMFEFDFADVKFPIFPLSYT